MFENRFVITLFGSGKTEPGSADYRLAYETGKAIAGAGFTLCNGGYYGTMEASARGAKDAAGKTIGIVTEFFSPQANPYIDNKIILKTLNERLLRLIETGDAYVILRGGTGTLVELATVWEYTNKSILREKPIIAIGNFWSEVIQPIARQLREEGSPLAAGAVTIASSPEDCVRILKEHLKKK